MLDALLASVIAPSSAPRSRFNAVSYSRTLWQGGVWGRALRRPVGPSVQWASGSGRTWMCTARGFEPLPPSLSQGGAVAVGAPQAAAFTGVGVVDAPVEALGEEAGRIGDAQHDHLAVLKGDEAVVEAVEIGTFSPRPAVL